MQRILVLRGGALGDFIVTLPALALLRRAWPSAHIELAGHARAAELAQRAGLLDRVHAQSDARWSALYAPPPLPAPLAAELAAFDLIVNFWPDPDGGLARHFPLHARQRFLSAAALPARAPAAAHYCAALAPLGLDPGETHFSLGIPHPDARFIAVHPGSGSPCKNWPLDRWRELLPQLPAPVSLILGEAELERCSSASFPSAAHFLLNRPLPELVAHFRDCRLFLGHDSGISHLAAACGVPCILLFGPTDPATWAPPGDHVRVLHRGPDLASLPVADVLGAVSGISAR